MDSLINKLLLIFVRNIRDYHLESQNALQHFVQSMLFRKESYLLCARPIKKQLGSIKDGEMLGVLKLLQREFY
jgi:hypothetical protein